MVECIIDGICRDAEYEIVVEEPAPDLVSISLSGNYRRAFTAGEQFSSEGLIVTANYNDGSSSVVTNYTVDSSDVDMNTPGIYLVYVKYSENGKNAKKQYKIKVSEAKQEDGLVSITLEGNYKTVFAIGGTFNCVGLKVIAHFADGSETLLKPEEVVVDASQVNMLRRGTYTVTVSFTFKGITKSATYEVTVKNGKISKDSL